MTKIIKEDDNGKNLVLNTKKIKFEDIPNLNKVSKDILNLLSKEELYPKLIAKKLKTHEQNIYYYIKKLEKSNLITVSKQENINGTIANFYTISSDSFYFNLREFKQTSKISQKESNYLNPFIHEGILNSLIIVGSPDPHGPQKARSRDGYFGMDLALFLGSYLNVIDSSKVRLDTEVTDKELAENNLIVLGGPIVNKISSQINDKMKIYFDENKKGVYSKCSDKTYYSEEIGYVNKLKSPYNKDKQILFMSGLRNAGTKAIILGFLKHFDKIKKPNSFNDKVYSHVVEGIDLDSDGQVDDVDFLE